MPTPPATATHKEWLTCDYCDTLIEDPCRAGRSPIGAMLELPLVSTMVFCRFTCLLAWQVEARGAIERSIRHGGTFRLLSYDIAKNARIERLEQLKKRAWEAP